MDDKIFDQDQIEEVDLKQKMEENYIDYAMSVIASRALPDVRDGLKPVQRRILYSMIELNNGPDKPHRKSARIVGDTMGKYHPHGDTSIYGALVNMAQDWSMRYPLVDGHGNFGSIDGDGAAAMRYTEARLSKISMEMVRDINKDTVDFSPNFDDTEKEPNVLPARFPNLLVNGANGIAVGMATNIPPHNLREIVNAVVKIVDNEVENDADTTIEEIMKIVKGPDFPTGAEILGHRGIEEAYRTGRGKIRVRAITNIETLPNGKSQIVVTEIPYGVNKAKLIEKMADLVRNKRIDGITGIADHSSREGMRITIDVRRDANANVILNQLYKHTELQTSFGVIMLALDGNQPKILNLKDMLVYYLKHQEEVVTRRTRYDLNKAEERAHILEGLLKALDHIDEIVHLIRASQNAQEAKTNLMKAFGFSDAQAQAIVDMRLRTLTGLERGKLQNEYDDLVKKIAEYKAILADHKLLLGVVKKEIQEIADKYGDDRRTRIGHDVEDFSNEDLIPDDNVVITMTHLGYVKRMTPDNFHSQNRGGKGIRGIQTLENDYIEDLFMTNTHSTLMFFTNLGRCYVLKAYQIPEAGRTARGTAIINMLQLLPDEKISAVIPISEEPGDQCLVFATKNGLVKKTHMSAFAHVNKKGIIAVSFREGDELIEVKYINKNEKIYLVTKKGMCICFNEQDIRQTGRDSMGVKGITLNADDEVIGMQVRSQGDYLLFVTENGIGKLTDIGQFTIQGRGGKGRICYKETEKTGSLVGVKAVNLDNEVMLINTDGIIIQTPVKGISIVGRAAVGVKVMNVKDGTKVAGLAKVRQEDEEDNDEYSEEEYSEENDKYSDEGYPEENDDCSDKEEDSDDDE